MQNKKKTTDDVQTDIDGTIDAQGQNMLSTVIHSVFTFKIKLERSQTLKGTSRQRSGKDAIRKRFPLQKTEVGKN